MSLNNFSVLANVIVDGNSITSGLDTSGTEYYYDTCVSTSADATFINNTISGIKSSSGIFGVDMVSMYGCTTKWSNNTFIRGPSGIRSYLNDTSTFIPVTKADHVITNNIFDDSTVDGSDELLIKNFSFGTTYERNKNQTDYLATQIAKYSLPNLQAPLTVGINTYPLSTLQQTIYTVIGVGGNLVTAENASLTFLIDISSIPAGAQIISATLGFTFGLFYSLDVSGSFTSTFGFTLYNSVSEKYDLSSLPLSYVDVYYNAFVAHNYGNVNLGTSNIISVNSLSQLNALLNHSNYLTLDLSGTPVYQTQYNKLYANIDFNLYMAGVSGSSAQILVSPLTVKYRY